MINVICLPLLSIQTLNSPTHSMAVGWNKVIFKVQSNINCSDSVVGDSCNNCKIMYSDSAVFCHV